MRSPKEDFLLDPDFLELEEALGSELLLQEAVEVEAERELVIAAFENLVPFSAIGIVLRFATEEFQQALTAAARQNAAQWN